MGRNKDRCSCSYSSGHKFGFDIGCGFGTDCSCSPFQGTDDLYSKPEFELALGSVFHRP